MGDCGIISPDQPRHSPGFLWSEPGCRVGARNWPYSGMESEDAPFMSSVRFRQDEMRWRDGVESRHGCGLSLSDMCICMSVCLDVSQSLQEGRTAETRRKT